MMFSNVLKSLSRHYRSPLFEPMTKSKLILRSAILSACRRMRASRRIDARYGLAAILRDAPKGAPQDEVRIVSHAIRMRSEIFSQALFASEENDGNHVPET